MNENSCNLSRRPPSIFSEVSEPHMVEPAGFDESIDFGESIDAGAKPRRPPSIVDELEAQLDLVGPQEAAERLGISTEQLDELVRRRRIMHFSNGTTPLFGLTDLDRWYTQNQLRLRRATGRLGFDRT